MTDPYIQINGTKIEVFDNDLSAVRTPKQLSDGTYATPSSGWIEISESWVYYSATTVTGATGVEDGIYGKSDKIRYKQGGAYKYAYITGNSGAACFLAGDAVTNAAITNIAYSHMINPVGYPTTSAYALPLLNSKIITATRDMTAASGDISYTGLDFTPTSMHIFAAISAGAPFSIGFADSSKVISQIGYYNPDVATVDNLNFYIYKDITNYQSFVIKTYDTGVGFTLTWTKANSPTGTATLSFLCFR